MARMSDEAFELKQEIREQKDLAKQAKYRRGHTGKGGAVRLSSDRLTKKQWEAKNGECKTYRMNEPMTWEQFNEMPDDLKVMYIKAIRKKYQTPDYIMAIAMDVPAATFSKEMRELGIEAGCEAGAENKDWYSTDESYEFLCWWYKEQKVGTYGGNLEIEGNVEEELKNLLETVKGRYVRLKLSWEVVSD